MDSSSSTIIQKITYNKWRQGSIFSGNQAVLQLADNYYIILSQDCDLCHSSFDDDPFIEIIKCDLIGNSCSDGNLTHGKNPRRIQFQLSDNNFYECHIKNRKFIGRQCLADFCPDETVQVSKKVLENLILWVTKRYNRDAFPFEFDKRLKNRKKLKKILENNGEHIIGVFIRLNTENELLDSEPYKMELFLLVDHDENYRMRADLTSSLENIYQLLIENTGIEVLQSYSIKTAFNITLGDFIEFKQLDFDYLSFRDFPDGKIL